MITRSLICLLALMSMISPVQAGVWDNIYSYFFKPADPTPPMIRVLIVHDKVGTVLEVKGKYRIFDPNTGEHISTRFSGKRKFIQAMTNGLKWGEEFPGVHQVMIVPDDQTITTVIDGIEYRGSVYVYDIGGAISVVNETYVEDYLDSILALEHREPYPREALAAIAIAARTNAYYQSEHPKNKFWDVDAVQVGYRGYAITHQSSGIEKAILATRYMIMKKDNRGGKLETFPTHWSISRISLSQAVDLANDGLNAAQILNKAFPNSKIQLMHYKQ